jgi:hypothetical protein
VDWAHRAIPPVRGEQARRLNQEAVCPHFFRTRWAGVYNAAMISLVLAGIVVGYIGFWFALSTVVARLGGWATLAQHYRVKYRPNGKRFSMQSGRFGWLDYNGCLRIIVADEGLYLSLWPRMMFSHPPLLLPWSDLKVLTVQDKWWGHHLSVAVGSPELARIRLPLKIVDYFDAQKTGGAHRTRLPAATEDADKPENEDEGDARIQASR